MWYYYITIFRILTRTKIKWYSEPTSEKIIDLNAYRSKKIKNDYNKIKKQISEILNAGSSHVRSQKEY